MKNTFRYYDLLLVLLAATLLVSNISATKLISLGSIIIDGGAVLFPLSYVVGDILTEVYGYRYARRAIWAAFGSMLLCVVIFTIVRVLPAAPSYTDQAAFDAVLGFFPRIVIASLVAFLVGSFVNSFVLAKLKVKTRGKQLWLRLISSTIVGELLDMIIFAVIAFGGILSGRDMLIYIGFGWLFKVGVEALLLPITYKVVNLVKKAERIDQFDKKTNFNPFSLKVK